MKKLSAEFSGTFLLVLLGTGAIAVNGSTGGGLARAGAAAAFGIAVTAAVFYLRKVSGAHINPAVTLGFLAGGRIPAGGALWYAAAQSAGAVAASLVISAIFSKDLTLGETAPSTAAPAAFMLETLLTFILMSVILRVSAWGRERDLAAGAAIGGTVALASLLAGDLTGASMNPARSLGPALVSGRMEHMWLYAAAPAAGAVLAVICRRLTHKDGCCEITPEGSPRGEQG